MIRWAKIPRWYRWFLGLSAAASVALAAWLIWGPSEHPAEEKSFPLPPFSASGFLNTGAEIHYVGIEACAKCHRGKHHSYLLTAHSRALADIDPLMEPPDGSFLHQASGRSYRVYRQDGKIRHEEVLRTAEGQEIARVDLPIRYRIGSGSHARTYLAEVDGFLHESPVTWYASKQKWGMSPGYDLPAHHSFERPIGVVCLACHVGNLELAHTVHRPILHEKAIGCESCHGPGSQHVALHKARKPTLGDEDLTIVNPTKLPRDRLESICSACHLMGAARVYVRGRQANDYRPGMPLTDYCIDYHFDTGSEQMTVVGHMEQLRSSVCYQKTKHMSCLTCHDPHAERTPKDPVAYYRQKCLSCHTDTVCKVDETERRKKNTADNCAACHMPRGDTDIPHIAFTHHRIGIHTPMPTAQLARIPNLVPIGDVSHLSEVDQRRNLGLAYLQAARLGEHAQFAGVFADRARTLLSTVHDAGMRDAATVGALADLYLPIDPLLARTLAQQALERKDASAEVRSSALILLAVGEMKDKNYPSAVGLFKQLVPLRRNSEDWGLLGMCYQLQNQTGDALTAFQQSLLIRPDRAGIHLKIAEIYQRTGNAQKATEHKHKSHWLSENPRK